MHAPVGAKEVGQIANPRFANHKRVEEPHFDIRMRIKRGENRVKTGSVVIIEEKPDADTTIGRGVQGFEQQRARHVLFPDVILNIQRPLGDLRQARPRGKGIARIRQQINSGEARMCFEQGRDRFSEARIGGI